ncbi:MAG: DUF3617 domain-containing protein [Burkholderiales bacterium]
MAMAQSGWIAAAALVAIAAGPVAAQSGDEQWELTMEMQMEGMNLPPTTQRVCRPPAKNERDDIPTEKDCKVLDFKRSGSRTTYTIQCDGERGKFTGTGEMEWQGKDAYRGRMRMTGTAEGRKFDATQTYSARRLGACNPADDPARKAIAQSQAQVKQVCDQAVDELAAVLVFPSANMPQPLCAERKADFCSRATRLSQEMKDPVGYRAVSGRVRGWSEGLAACGIDAAALTRDVCRSAVSKQDWDLVVGQCKDESAALRKERCAGRTYTTVDAANRELCSRLGGLSYTATPADAGKAQPVPGDKPGITDKLKEGAGRLKKFLKF